MLLGEAKSSVLMVSVIALGKLFKDLVIDEPNFQTSRIQAVCYYYWLIAINFVAED